MRLRFPGVSLSETSDQPPGIFLLKKPGAAHELCEQPSYTPWSSEEDKFGKGTIWQCAECRRVYVVAGTDPVVSGFWEEISFHRAQRLLKKHGHRLLP